MAPRAATPSERSLVGRRVRELRRRTGEEVLRLRTDSHLSQVRLAAAAGIAQSSLSAIERGLVLPTLPVLQALATSLGADLAVRLYPNAGPTIRDRSQTPILQALISELSPRWRRPIEVPVHRPARGVIDLVLHDPMARLLVAVEIESRIIRLEQQIRWANEKADSLRSTDLWRQVEAAGPVQVSQLLVLRATRPNREIAISFDEVLRATFPANPADALAALRGVSPWPGPTLLWADVSAAAARIRDRPPRGVRVGRDLSPSRPISGDRSAPRGPPRGSRDPPGRR